ncbi:biotin/lipoyl-containing protein [Vogesella sp.]|uniref:acetyl-CoA carboxylase biotin carboxyl carrier protein subunit n=1 Tax=Vogesella sp. TaxID=1904252 RepID=UPI003F66FB23
MDTGLIARHHDSLLPAPAAPTATQLALLGLAEVLASQAGGDDAFVTLQGWRLNGSHHRSIGFALGDTRYTVTLQQHADGYRIEAAGSTLLAQAALHGHTLRVTLDGKQLAATVVRHGSQRVLFADGERVAVDYVDPYAFSEAGVHGETHLKAPMPGRVVALVAEAGARIAKGEPLLILEAMKMEHTITAPADGVVKAFYFAAGEQVGDGDELVDFEAD